MNNCGKCGSTCTVPNGVGKCSAGVCSVASCYSGYLNINGACTYYNLQSDVNNWSEAFRINAIFGSDVHPQWLRRQQMRVHERTRLMLCRRMQVLVVHVALRSRKQRVHQGRSDLRCQPLVSNAICRPRSPAHPFELQRLYDDCLPFVVPQRWSRFLQCQRVPDKVQCGLRKR